MICWRSFLSRQNLTDLQLWTLKLPVYNRKELSYKFLMITFNFYAFSFALAFQFQREFSEISWKWWGHAMLLINYNDVVTYRDKLFHSFSISRLSCNSCCLYFTWYDHRSQGGKAEIFRTCTCITSPRIRGVWICSTDNPWIWGSTLYISSEPNTLSVSKNHFLFIVHRSIQTFKHEL